MTRSDLKAFFEWADRRGMAFGEFVDNRDQSWFREARGDRLDDIIDRFLAQQSKPLPPPRIPSQRDPHPSEQKRWENFTGSQWPYQEGQAAS